MIFCKSGRRAMWSRSIRWCPADGHRDGEAHTAGAGVDRHLLPGEPTAANPPHAGVAGDWNRRTEGQTGRTSYRFITPDPAPHNVTGSASNRAATGQQTRRGQTGQTDGRTDRQTPYRCWRCGAVVSGVRHMNEVNARRTRLVPGWVTVFGRVYHLGM